MNDAYDFIARYFLTSFFFDFVEVYTINACIKFLNSNFCYYHYFY